MTRPKNRMSFGIIMINPLKTKMMDTRTRLEIVVAVLLVAILLICAGQQRQIKQLQTDRDKYKSNTESLLTDVETYRVRDSLNAARVQSLEMSVKEFERFRAEDAALIREMTERNRDLSRINKTQAQTIIALQAIPRDTIIVRDSVSVPAVAVHCGDAWYDFDGVLTDKEFTGTLVSRDSILIAESVQYKRFLGFLWRTSKVKNRRVDVTSKNPHTRILNVEHIVVGE